MFIISLGSIVSSVLKSGDIHLYWKDQSRYETIAGLPEFNAGVNFSESSLKVYV